MALAAFHMLSNHVGVAVTILGSADTEHCHQGRKSLWRRGCSVPSWAPAYGCPFGLCSQCSCLLQDVSCTGTRRIFTNSLAV